MSDVGVDVDWSKTTWEGSRREQLRRWRKLSLREKLLAVEEMADLSRHLDDMRLRRRQRKSQIPPGKTPAP
jgi:CRISPR-associated protein Csx17